MDRLRLTMAQQNRIIISEITSEPVMNPSYSTSSKIPTQEASREVQGSVSSDTLKLEETV